MTLTSQQQQAMEKFKAFIADKDRQVFILKGYAGTGKTTLIRCMAEYLHTLSRNVELMAPTGRAAKILRSKVEQYVATTIHQTIYSFEGIVEEENEGTFKYIYPLKTSTQSNIFIIDEASMVSSRKSDNELFQFGSGILINDVLSYARLHFGGKIIFVGDAMQLPPVGDNCSVALDEVFFQNLHLNVTSFELTDIVRQSKESCILANATKIRKMVLSKERNHLVFDKKDNEVMDIDAMNVAQNYCASKEKDKAIVCFSNQQATDYNAAIRKIFFPHAKQVTAGDKLMIVCNNYAGEHVFLNGDIITVVEVSSNVIAQSAPVWTERNGKKVQETVTLNFREISFRAEDGNTHTRYIIDTLLENNHPSLTIDEMKSLYINFVIRMREEKHIKDKKKEEFVKAMKNDPFYNALQVKYGYAFTCHKAQGGEWNTVYVDFAKRTGLDTDSLRWKYTAITRASKTLWCVNLPDITAVDTLRIMAIKKTTKVAKNALSFDDVEETPFHLSNVLSSVKCKYWSVVKNMEGTKYAVTKVECKPWRDIYEVETPTGTARVDAIYNGAGMFTNYETDANNAELLPFFQDEENIRYKIDYHPSLESLKALYHRMISLCDECGIVLTNVVEGNYQVAYYMKASGQYASMTFFFSGKGVINYAAPLSDVGENDEKLSVLIEKLYKR